MAMPRTKPLEQRFWSKVDKRDLDECWTWTAATNHRGYGQLDGRKATHVAWELTNNKPFPVGKIACHTCDNPSCVNPAHIWPGTQKENMADCIAKGRFKYNPLPQSRTPKSRPSTPEYCIRCGHHRTDDLVSTYKGRTVRHCRPCNRAASRACHARRRAA